MTPKQEQFCREYLIDLCATQAAIRAGYSARTANREASRLLSKVDIQARIAELMAQRSEETGINAAWVLLRLARIADLDIRLLFDADGNLKPINELGDDPAYAIAGIDIGELTTGDGFSSQTKKIKFCDRLKALELIGRHLAMFTDRVEQSGNVGQVTIVMPDNGRS